MNMMFRYCVAFPRRVALDANESVFAVFARPHAVNRLTGQAVRCFAGWCIVDGTNLGYECEVITRSAATRTWRASEWKRWPSLPVKAYQHELKEMARSVDSLNTRDTPVQWIRADLG